jgi:hypothetical protein
MSIRPCVGCGASFPELEGPVHRYMESSPGCWAAYGEVLAREYGSPACFAVHRLTVDSYAVQHPGRPSAQSIQSVAVHLIRLCLTLERGLAPSRALAAIQAAVKAKGRYVWLTPPAARGQITVADVRKAGSVAQHTELVQAWARSAWQAWSVHHAVVRSWLPALELKRGRA